MRFDLITIFPEFFSGPLEHGIVRRAREAGIIDVHVQDLREFTKDRHRTVDDRPFGGGEGMVLKPEPLFEAVEALLGHGVGDASTQRAADEKTAIVLLSAAGKLFRQDSARRFAKLERMVFICGRYEGVDERVAEHLATEEISVGDFVLSGGELPAMVIVDAVTRLLPGALGNEASAENESFSAGSAVPIGTQHAAPLRGNGVLLDYPNPSATPAHAPSAMKMSACNAWRCGLPEIVGNFAPLTTSSETGIDWSTWFRSGPPRPTR